MVSVVIPTYNRAPFLRKAIESVLSQTYQDFELIVVNDGSEDNTNEVISSYDKRITCINQKNKGPSAARNTGLRESKRPFVAFLDSDDWWDKEKLAIQLKVMQENPSYLISHTQEIWFKNGRLLNQKKKHRKYHGYIFDKCLAICCVSMSTVMVRRNLFDKVGLFDEDLPCCEDYDFWLRASVNYKFLLIDKPLTLKDGGRPDQVNYIYRTGMDRFRIYAIIKLIKSGSLNAEQMNLALREAQRKCRIYGTGCIKHKKAAEGRYYLDLPQRSRLNLNLDFILRG